METNISLRVGKLKSRCETNVEFISGDGKGVKPLFFNQRDVIRRINFYIHNRFLERDDDAIFWNISTYRITHFAKLISPDTKDFYPYGLGELNFFQAWALRKKVKEWFDDNAFYRVLNDLSEGLATYGSVVWKRYIEDKKTIIKEVRLENVYFDQTVENIQDADGIVEVHHLNEKEIRDKRDIWENIDEVLEKDEDSWEIWEYYGYDYEDGNPEYVHIIGYGYGDEFLELWRESLDKDECPYFDFHLGRNKGRWLGIGVVERLFRLQERVNQLVNQNAQSTEIASLLLLQSGQADSSGNVLEQAVNGQIIPDETLRQIGITNTGLNQFINEMQLIERQADKLCLTPEILQGESSPSNTTFRGIAVVNAGAVNAFKNYRQDVFEKIADILLEYIFPDVIKGWNKDDLIEMAEDDVDVEEYDKAIERKRELDFILSGVGNVLTPELQQMLMQDTEEKMTKTKRQVSVPKGFFNFKFGFKMVPTDDSVDKSARNDAYFNSLQMTAANSAITEVPGFKQYLEDNGISPWKLTPKQAQAIKEGGNMNALSQKEPDKLLAQAQPNQ